MKIKKNNIKIKEIVLKAIIITLILFTTYKVISFLNGPPLIGKELIITVDDYEYDADKLHDYAYWYDHGRLEMCEYMRNNNLVLKPGVYSINQVDSFEDVLEIFEFVEKEEE